MTVLLVWGWLAAVCLVCFELGRASARGRLWPHRQRGRAWREHRRYGRL